MYAYRTDHILYSQWLMRKQQKFTKLAQHCLHRYITTVDDNQGSAHVTRHKQSSGTEGMKGVKLKSSVEI